MNREIKFRAFNEKGIDEGKWLYFDLNSNPHTSNFTLVEWMNLPKCQFTALHDKNGKEIYEGDILKDSNGKIISVCWDDSAPFMPGFRYDEINKGSTILLGDGIEVIGNIYGNPELLNPTSPRG